MGPSRTYPLFFDYFCDQSSIKGIIMRFRDIPGREDIATRLRASVAEERVSHAQLFTGGEGTGKLAMAMAYAAYINCTAKSDSDSCGECASCRKADKLIHPDIHFVFPVVRNSPSYESIVDSNNSERKARSNEPVSDNYIKEWRKLFTVNPFFSLNDWLKHIHVENAQGLIYAQESAEIIRKLSLKTYESEYKIMIIWLPERMHPTAANKLLKMIEEPPGKTLFILVSEEPDHILPTIMSRCQMVHFTGISREAIFRHLKKHCELSSEKAEEIAHVANGNLVRAIALADNEELSGDDLKRFSDLMRAAWKRDLSALIRWADESSTTGREAQKNFLVYGLGLLRGNYIMNHNGGERKLTFMTNREVSFSEKFHPWVNNRNIGRLYKEFNSAHQHIESNGNPRIVFLDMALKVAAHIRR